jgi:hypothetical protein
MIGVCVMALCANSGPYWQQQTLSALCMTRARHYDEKTVHAVHAGAVPHGRC